MVTSWLWAVTGSLSSFRASGLAILLLGALILALGLIRATRLHGTPIISGIGSRLAIISSTLAVALHWDTYGGIILAAFENG